MSIFEQLTQDMKEAMKAGEKERLNTIRLLRNEIKNASIDKQKELEEEDEIQVLSKAAKKRKESIDAYHEAGREDLAEKEQKELEIIQSYLPQPLTPEELEKIIDNVIKETNAQTIKDLGKVMSVVMKQVKGRADGKEVNRIVREKLGV